MKPAKRYLVLGIWGLVVVGGLGLVRAEAPVRVFGPTTGQGQTIFVEDSPTTQELAAEAMQLRDQGRYADAVQKLQEIVEDYPHKLMPSGTDSYTDALLWVREAIRQDSRLLEAYESLFGVSAEREVSESMPSADRGVDANRLRSVMFRYFLTRAGLDAGLMLAAYHLERAEAAEALSILDDLSKHPGWEERALRYHQLSAVALLLDGDRRGYESHRQACQAIDGSGKVVEELESLSHRIHPPSRIDEQAQAEQREAHRLPDQLNVPLWEVDLWEGLWQSGLGNRPDLRHLPAEQGILRLLPAASAQHVLANTGEQVWAYDRASGWKLWELPGSDPATQVSSMEYPGRAMLTEPRGVSVEQGRAYAVIGWYNPNLMVMPHAQRHEKAGVSLIAIDIEAGELRWRVSPVDLDPLFTKGGFDGTPIADGDRVYAFIKRVQVSGLYDLYLVASRASDGHLIWKRHLSSSSLQTHYNAGPSPRMTLHHGRLYISDNRGSVCALDARSGTMHWITLLPQPDAPNPAIRRQGSAARDLPEPIRIRAGLLIAPYTETDDYRLLDPTTGRILRDLTGDEWADVEACYPAGDDVVGVGGAVVRFDGETLEPKWRVDLDAGRDGKVVGRPGIDPDMIADPTAHIAGRPPQGVIVFTTPHRLIALNCTTGRRLLDQPIDAPGNIRLVSGQVLLATPSNLYSYIDWQLAYRQLMDRSLDMPDHPGPGLALARLAMRVGRDDAVLEGIDLAMSALERKQQHEAAETVSRHQAEVFEQISRFVQMRAEVSSDLTEALLDRMAVLASLPEQEATYHLFRGGYEAEVGRFEVAVEHYQAVLADADQASALFVSQAGSRRAGLEATRRIKALIQAHGKVVYAAFDLQAESALQDLILTGETDPQPYVELAERYPLAAVTSRARSMAAELYEQSGSSALALKQWQAVYLDAVDASQAANATERIVSTYLSLDQPVLARRWLRRVQRKYPQLLIHHAGGTVSIDSWIAELDEALSHVGSLPKLTPPLTATKWIDGQPVPWDRGQVPADAVHDRVLMRVGRELVMLASPDLRELWRCPIPSPDIKLLSMTEKQLIWWSQQAGLVGALDSRSGEALWPSIRLMDQLRSVGDPGRRPDSRTSQQREFIQLLGGVAVRHNLPSNVALTSPLLVKADPEVLVVADRLGRVICVDRMTGQVRWRILSEADGLIDVAVGEGLMALGGASWADTEAQHGLISFHDTLTGEQIGTTIQTETTPTWIEFTERGLLISADANRVAAYDPLTGRTEWRHDLLRMAAPARHWLAGDVLLRQPQQGDVGSAVVLDATNGERLNLIPIRRSPAKPLLMDARFTEQGWHILTPNQAWALDSTGQTRWSDAVCGPVGHIAMQQVSDQYVWLVSVNEPLGPAIPIPVQLQVQAQQNPQLERVLREAIQAARPADGEPARLYGLERETGRIVSETALPALPGLTPDSGVLIDGALLIGSRGRTLVISGRPADN